ncbi:MAG: hypothetical protein V1660_00115 [archaeon]
MMIAKEILIFAGAFIGCLLAMSFDYKKNFKDYKAWVFSFLLSFAVFGIYEVLVSLEYFPATFSSLGLFGISMFIGFSIKSLTKKFWEIVNKG